MRQPFNNPHVTLMEGVPRGFWMAGPLDVALLEGGQHVTTDRIVPEILLVHCIQHLGRDQQRHCGTLPLVTLDTRQQRIRYTVPKRNLQFTQILSRMLSLPDSASPLLGCYIFVPR